MKKALITGITGQDGSYLAELLLNKEYEVHGIIRRSSSFNTGRIDHIFKKINLHYGDVTDSICIDDIINKVKPDEIYHLAAQSHVKISFDIPKYTSEVDALGTLYILEAMRKYVPKCKFYNATTSELFGKVQEIPQKETTPFYPRSPYGIAKLYSYWITKNYKESYNLFTVNGLLFNHESERRNETFVTKKIISKLVEVKECLGQTDSLKIGNLDAKRDWGYAPEYVLGMWMMLQQKSPEDFVLATGETHSVRELVEITCNILGLDLVWRGSGVNEIGYSTYLRKNIIEIDTKYFRPTEVDILVGDATKAHKLLGWKPKVKFKELIQIMIDYEYK
jgi:GDPmannose 4,6-dehydratase